MFYSPAILAKKGELSKIWLAAHWQNRLSKQQAMSVDIAESCQAIKQPAVPLSLRLSGQLLHGVARIHTKKVTYLSEDCSDALLKIKMAFRPGVVNLSAQDAAATPSKINAPAMNANDDDLQSPAMRTSSKNKFQGVEPKVDEDDWTNLTPVHARTAKRSLTRQTPTYDDSDARSTTTMDEKEEQWSEFPFHSDDMSSVELVRKADETKSVASEQQKSNAEYQPYDYEDVNAIGDEDFRPSEGGGEFSHPGGSGMDEGLMLSGQNQSWIDDVAMREDEEENIQQQKEKASTKKASKKEKKQAPGTGTKRKKKLETVTELTNEQIQGALQDASDTILERMAPRERAKHEDELRSRGFPVRFAQVGFDSGLEMPATTGLHPKLVQMFKQNAKPVPSFSGEKETSMEGEEEDVEVARAATLTSGTDDMGGHTGPEEYHYEEVDVVGDETFRASNAADQTDFSASRGGGMDEAPDELELTFQDEGAGQSPTRAGRGSGATPTSARRSQATSSQVMVGEGEKWNPQTIKMMKLLREKLTEAPAITYQELAEGQRRTIVAKAFFEVLTLTTRDMISVAQKDPFGEIRITPGRKYDTLLPGE